MARLDVEAPPPHNRLMRMLAPEERAELEALARHLHALKQARDLARDAFLSAVHHAVCRGIKLHEIAFAVCAAQGLRPGHVHMVAQRLKAQLYDYRIRMGIVPCSPRSRSRRVRMPPLSEAS